MEAVDDDASESEAGDAVEEADADEGEEAVDKGALPNSLRSVLTITWRLRVSLTSRMSFMRCRAAAAMASMHDGTRTAAVEANGEPVGAVIASR